MKKVKAILTLLMSVTMIFAFCACGGAEEKVDSSPITDEEITELYTSPENFTGRTFEFTGRVLEVEKEDSELYLQVYQDIANYENNTIVTYPKGDVSVKDDDYVKISGTVVGLFTGENYLGTEVTAPQISATKIEVIDALEAFPAKRTIDVNETIEKGAYKATVSKVDYTDTETRIYITVENNSSANFDNYPDQGVIIQNGKQYEAEWNDEYPEPNTELRAGVTSECVIAFTGVEESDFTYTFSGYDEETYDELEFSFDIAVE